MSTDFNYSELSSILPIEKNNGKNLVDARKLHAALGVGRMFAHWISERIEKYELIEGEDYVAVVYDYAGNRINELAKSGKPDTHRFAKIEYGLTIDAAKELCMVENNEKGKQIRKYFLLCEKELRRIEEDKLLHKDPPSPLMEQAQVIKFMMDDLNMSNTSKLMAYQSLMDKVGIQLPAYIEGARVSFSATDLLKKLGAGISAKKFNELAAKKGLIVRKERISSSSPTGVKDFWNIPDQWLNYGENLQSPKNPRETQIHWYEDTFEEVLKMLGVK